MSQPEQFQRIFIKTLDPVAVSSPGTAVTLTPTHIYATAVYLQAYDTNAGSVYVGDSTVTSSNGAKISPGEVWQIACDTYPTSFGVLRFDLNQIYIDASSPGDTVRVQIITGSH